MTAGSPRGLEALRLARLREIPETVIPDLRERLLSDEAVEAVTRHRVKRAEEQVGVGEVGPLLRETLRAEVEDWLPVLAALFEARP